MPNLTRSTLYRCLKRRGLSRIGPTATCSPLTTAAVKGPYRFEIAVHDIVFRDHERDIGVGHSVILAVEEKTRYLNAEVSEATPENAAAFLANLAAQFHEKIIAVATDIRPAFTDWRAGFNEDMASVGPHPFAVACRALRMVHVRSIPASGQAGKIRPRGVEIR